jgi:hypothetical protein
MTAKTKIIICMVIKRVKDIKDDKINIFMNDDPAIDPQ